MAKNLADLRLQVRRDDGYLSSPWRLWVTKKGDVYLTGSQTGGVDKYSFHVSGICRSAFTNEYAARRGMTDRIRFSWQRAATAPKGRGRWSRVAWIAFPTDYLSRLAGPKIGTNLIPAAPAGGATFIDVGFTAEAESSVREPLEAAGGVLWLYVPLPSGEAAIVRTYSGEWENNDITSPGNAGTVFPDLKFSANDPDDTGRPIRIALSPYPEDGGQVVIQELGGFVVAV